MLSNRFCGAIRLMLFLSCMSVYFELPDLWRALSLNDQDYISRYRSICGCANWNPFYHSQILFICSLIPFLRTWSHVFWLHWFYEMNSLKILFCLCSLNIANFVEICACDNTVLFKNKNMKVDAQRSELCEQLSLMSSSISHLFYSLHESNDGPWRWSRIQNRAS